MPWGKHIHTRACYRYQRETQMLAIDWMHRHEHACHDCHGSGYVARVEHVPEAGSLVCQCIEAGQCSACGEFSRPENDLTTPCTRCGFFPEMTATDPDPLETRPMCICGALDRMPDTQATEVIRAVR